MHTQIVGWAATVVSKPQTAVATVSDGKGTLNAEVSTDRSINGAEEWGDRQAVGVFGITFSL